MRNVGVYRNEADMKTAIKDVQNLREEFQSVRVEDSQASFNSDLLGILELQNLLDLSLVTAASALNRTESRGGHSRKDFPERNDEQWLKHTLSTLKGNEVEINYKSVDTSIWKPKPRTY